MVKASFIDIQTFKQALSKRDHKVAEAFSYVSNDIGKLSAELDQHVKQTTKNEKSYARDLKLQLASIVKIQKANQRDLKKLAGRFEKFESKLNGHGKTHFMRKSFSDLAQWVKKGSLETEQPKVQTELKKPKAKPKPKKKLVVKSPKPTKPAVSVPKQATKNITKPKVTKIKTQEPIVEEIDHEYLDRLQERNATDDSDPLSPFEERTFFEEISEGKDEEGKKRKWKVQRPKSDFDWLKEDKP